MASGFNDPSCRSKDILTFIRDVGLDQAVVLTDANADDNLIFYCNHAFSRLTGYAKEEALGRDCRFLQGPDTDRDARQQLREAIARAHSIEVDILNYRKDGTPFWLRLKIAPLFGDFGELRAFVGIHTPIARPFEAH